MSELDAQDKQHLATGKRLAELRRQGTVLRSRDLSGALIFISSIIVLIFISQQIKETFEYNFLQSFGSIKEVLQSPEYFSKLLKNIILKNFNILLPIFIVTFVIALLSPFLFGGWNFTLEVLQFKFQKLDPTQNLKRLFSLKHTSLEIIRSLVKALIILGVLFFYFMINKTQIINLLVYSSKLSIQNGAFIVKHFIILLSISLIAIVLFDMVYHYFQFQSKSKMSTQEIKDETKETEGDVQTKRRIRSAQMSLLKQKLSQSVPKANVIIVNPTHYAVALKYHSDKDHAPKLLAKGKGFVASKIKQIAIANAIPIYEAPSLARAIFYTTQLNSEIHPGLYMAVAIVLSYVYQLKNYQMGISDQLPNYVADLKIPQEFIYHE